MTRRPAAPAYVQFYPTLRCNLACAFCFNRGLGALPDVAPADFARLLDRLRAAGVGTLDLLGGEPTLHPGLEELLGAIAARGMRTTLSTNGRVDLGLLERLEDRFGRETLRIGVSVNDDTLPPSLAGYIAKRMPLLKSVCAREARLPPVVAEHLGRPSAEFFLIFRDPLSPRDLSTCLSYPAYAERLATLRREHPGVDGVACEGFVPRHGEDLAREVRCPAGTGKLSVLPDGSVFPCYLLFSRPEFRLGNLLTDPFEAIWDNPRLDFFRTFSGNVCPRGECAYHAACHGGCPAVSLLVAGDIAAPDPRCQPFAGTLGAMETRPPDPFAHRPRRAWRRVSVEVPGELADAAADLLAGITGSGVEIVVAPPGHDGGSRERILGYLPEGGAADAGETALRREVAALAARAGDVVAVDVRSEPLLEEDWGARWKEHFRPFHAAPRLVIKPTWEPYEPRAGEAVIEMDPGMAFGTGLHESTRLALGLIEELCAVVPPPRVLDVGTGTGVLALAAALRGAGFVRAVDTDPDAVAAARGNAERNRLAGRVRVDGEGLDAIPGPFDLIAANITADVLLALAPQLVGRLAPGGALLLSGILAGAQAREVRAAYERIGLCCALERTAG